MVTLLPIVDARCQWRSTWDRRSTMRSTTGDEETTGVQAGKALKRRGLIAGAAALAAGIAAKQASQPVVATTIDTRFIANGTTGSGFSASTGFFEYGVYA